jgi:catechol 2,3-dioxygenase-like lactoylglutathione lyase family enzyme
MAGARLSHVFVVVSDLERTRSFHVDVLGLQLLEQRREYVRVGGGGGFYMGLEEGESATPTATACRSSHRSPNLDHVPLKPASHQAPA